MKLYIHSNRVILIGKSKDILLTLKQCRAEFCTVKEWLESALS